MTQAACGFGMGKILFTPGWTGGGSTSTHAVFHPMPAGGLVFGPFARASPGFWLESRSVRSRCPFSGGSGFVSCRLRIRIWDPSILNSALRSSWSEIDRFHWFQFDSNFLEGHSVLKVGSHD